MMETGIFKYIWRINALLVLVVGIGMVFILAGNLIDNGIFSGRHERQRMVLEDQTLKLSRPTLVGNGEFYLFALSPGGRLNQMGEWKMEPIRNFLIVDAATNGSRWMFPDTMHTILKWEEVHKEVECGFESVGIKIVDIPEDSNGDGVKDQRDRKFYLVASKFDAEPRNLAGEPVEKFWCEENDGRLFCQFRTTRGMETALFKLDDDMTQLERSVLPAIPSGEAGGGG